MLRIASMLVARDEEAAMQIEISEDQAVVLRDVLDTWLGDVSAEIRHTDNPGVRNGLRERRDCVRGVREQIATPEQAAG
jgi:hypothetical protein